MNIPSRLAKGGYVERTDFLVGESGCSYILPKPKIGIGFTTKDRHSVLGKSYIEMLAYLPDNAFIVVVDDASKTMAPFTTYRFEQNSGIARAKNKCLELLQDCDHIFLFDDDTYPIAPDWWKPFVESKEPHLMYQFKLPGKQSSDMRVVHKDKDIVVYTHTRGAMLYVERRVLDVVGGMDTAYGQGMYEHTDWTNRIHNAGLTTHRAMDIPNSDKLLYCLDQNVGTTSSISAETRKRNILANRVLYQKSKTSKEYKEFRT